MRPIIVDTQVPRVRSATKRSSAKGCSGMAWLIAGLSIMSCCLVLMSYAYFSSSRNVIAYSSPRNGITLQTGEPVAKVDRPDRNSLPTSNVPRPSEGPELASSRSTLGEAVKSVAEVKRGYFFRLQEERSGLWLSRTVDTNAERSLEHERVFLINYVKHYDAWSLQGHTRMHLTCELNDRVTLDRKWARSFEMWMPSFTTDGLLILQSRRNKMYLRTSGVDNDQLTADTSDVQRAARWRLYRDASAKCGAKPDAKLPKKEQLERLRDECWGAEGGARNAFSPLSSKVANLTLPLFGSPKPLMQLAPKDATDHYDTFIISNRTLHNWAMIRGVEPFLLADDSGTQSLVQTINRGGKTVREIALQASGFEIQRQYSQPTYRGLFDAALRRFPTAVAVMYSNSDILYTPSLVETVRSVVDYVERERERKVKAGQAYRVRGWMIVGQRVNHDVPATWGLGERWVETVESDFAKQGDLFESDAEDYFIVSRGLFDWMKDIPDFVVGGVAFDNWLTNKVNVMAAAGEAIEVDGSKTIVAVHQNHGGDAKKSHAHPKSFYNQRLAGKHGGMELGHVTSAGFETLLIGNHVVTMDKHRLLMKA